MKIAAFTYNILLLAVALFQQEEKNPPEIIGDILEPDPLPFTFETIGWKILGVLLLIVAIVLFYKWIKLYITNKYRREAIDQLQLIEAQETENQNKINQLNIILKQVAIITFGRQQVAQLYGEDWLLFLDSKYKKGEFLKYANNFSDALYNNKTVDQATLNSIVKLTKTWIREHS